MSLVGVDSRAGVVKLVHLADYGGPYAGSFIPMLLEVLVLGRDRGYDSHAIFTDIARGRPWLAELDAAGIPYRFTPVEGIAETVHDVSLQGDCVLHSHFSAFDLSCARAARRGRALAFWHVHSSLRHGLKPRARNSVRFGLLSRGVSEIMCVAPHIARDVRLRLGPRDRVTFVPNAIDLARFPMPDGDARLAARTRLGLPTGGIVLMHFGWDWERKGGEIYLRAVAALRRTGREVTAVTVGEDNSARRVAAELGLTDVVRVLAPTDEVQDLYAAANVFVMPSLAEGMPFAMAEALSSGTPVVATDASGEREIGAGLAACRLTDRRPEAVAAAIGTLLDRDASTVQADASAARRSLDERLALPVWAESLLARYTDAQSRSLNA